MHRALFTIQQNCNLAQAFDLYSNRAYLAQDMSTAKICMRTLKTLALSDNQMELVYSWVLTFFVKPGRKSFDDGVVSNGCPNQEKLLACTKFTSGL